MNITHGHSSKVYLVVVVSHDAPHERVVVVKLIQWHESTVQVATVVEIGMIHR